MTRTALKAGFTLIELMIVVAIIGLLAALAIPNFLKFQARARQSECRANLKSVFTAEKSYYGDKQTYYDVLSVVGFEPEMNNRYSYFSQASTTGELRPCGAAPTFTNCASVVNPNGPQGSCFIEADEKWTSCTPAPYVAPTAGGFVAPAPSGVTMATTVGVSTLNALCGQGLCEFTAGAAGNIDNDPSIDQWFISSVGGTSVGAPVSTANACVGAAGNTGIFAEGEPVNVCNDVSF